MSFDIEVAMREHADGITKLTQETKTELAAGRAEAQRLIDEVKSASNGLSDRLDQLEAKSNRRQSEPAGRWNRHGVGAAFVKAGGLERLTRERRKSSGAIDCNIELKAIINNGRYGEGDFPTQETRLPGIVEQARRPFRFLDILTVVPVKSDVAEWISENVWTNNAQIQGAGASPSQRENVLKGESDVTFQRNRLQVETIAHFQLASKQVLDDNAQLQQFIDRLLMYGLMLELEDQSLNGNGTDGQFTGLLPALSAFTPASTADTTIDLISAASASLDAAGYVPTAVLMHPNTWHGIRTEKDMEGRYLSGTYSMPAQPMMWNLPVVPSASMPESKIVVGDFASGCALLERQAATVEISMEDNDNFRRNMVTVRAELRGAFQLRQSAAFRLLNI